MSKPFVGRALVRFESWLQRFGDHAAKAFQIVVLFAIGLGAIWSAADFYITSVRTGGLVLHDLLLLFIYLELGAMLRIYFMTSEIRVEFLLFVAITAVTRSLVQVEDLSELRALVMAVAVLILALAVAVLHFATPKQRQHGPGETSPPATARNRTEDGGRR